MEPKNVWEKKALCRGLFTEQFFPEGPDVYKKTCTDCPVIRQCKSYAIAHEEIGIWGGTSRNERNRLPTELKDAIRNVYYEAGLLEYRPGVVETYVRQRQSLDRAHSSIIVSNLPNDS